jgi:hypothetical protein
MTAIPYPAAFAVAASRAASSMNASVPQRAHGQGDHLRGLRCRARPALGGCRRPGRRRRRAQGCASCPVTQPVRGRCSLSCGGSKNTICRSWSWQLLHATRTCPMSRPRPAASRASLHTPSSSPAHCRATAGDRTGRIQACSRTEKRTSKRSCPDQLPRVNDHCDVSWPRAPGPGGAGGGRSG